MLKNIELSGKSEGKGRNGYFRIARISGLLNPTDPEDQHISIDFCSSRSGVIGPARLALTVEDAKLLHDLLTELITEERVLLASTRAQCPVRTLSWPTVSSNRFVKNLRENP